MQGLEEASHKARKNGAERESEPLTSLQMQVQDGRGLCRPAQSRRGRRARVFRASDFAPELVLNARANLR